jgi:hypothetical protein
VCRELSRTAIPCSRPRAWASRSAWWAALMPAASAPMTTTRAGRRMLRRPGHGRAAVLCPADHVIGEMTAGERVYLANAMGLVTLTSVRQSPITSIPTKCRPCCRSSGASPAQISRSRSMTASALGFQPRPTCPGLVTLAMTACRSAAWAVIISVGAAGTGVPSMRASRQVRR